ncbi:MAG: hypothetical protein ACI8TP_004264, partial [Acidimicrobiales bacterium]
AVADLDADGDLEVIIGSGLYFGADGPHPIGRDQTAARRLYAFGAATGATVAGFPVDTGAVHNSSPAVGNLDDDPQLEIATSNASGQVMVYEHNGAQKWSTCALHTSFPCPHSALNGLGTSVSIADVDNDGANEVVAYIHTHLIIMQGSDGSTETDHEINLRYVSRAQPTVVNHQGKATIIVQNMDEVTGAGPSAGDNLTVTVLTTNAPLGTAPWAMFRQNAARTGSAETSWEGSTWVRPWLAVVYEDLLGRSIDQAGSDYWASRLSGGLTRSQAAYQFAASDEWAGVVVDDIYQSVLGRAPDASGRNYWVGRLTTGTPTSQIVASVFASDEYFASVGGTNALFVDALYQGILDRGPDASGHAYWTNRLTGGEPRGTLSAVVYHSKESGARRVDSLYASLLDRSPDAAGRDYWATYLQTGDEIALAALLVNSDEYVEKAKAAID